MASFRVSPPPPHSPRPNPASGNRVRTSHSHIFHVLNVRFLCAVGWGVACSFSGLSTKQRNIVFWWFLRSYMTSGPSSCWYFLLLKLRIFWCYLSLQVMAILCCVAKNSLRGTPVKTTFRVWCLYSYLVDDANPTLCCVKKPIEV